MEDSTHSRDNVSAKGGGTIPQLNGGYQVTSKWGNRTDPITGQKADHNGVDFAMPTGTKLSSNVQGTVVYSGWGKSGTGYGNYGNVVAIKDFSGKTHLFAHLDSVNVKVGQKVNAGDLLGATGSTGRSTGPHLHYEVRSGGYGTDIDPSPYLKGGFSGSTLSSSPSGSIKKGAKGESVRELQSLLGIKADGIFGPQTEKAVRSYQSRKGLSVDGVVGPQTWSALRGSSSASGGGTRGNNVSMPQSSMPIFSSSTSRSSYVPVYGMLGGQKDPMADSILGKYVSSYKPLTSL